MEKGKRISDERINVYIHKAIHRKGGIYTKAEFEAAVREYEAFIWAEGATFDQLVRFRCEINSAPVIAGGFRGESDAEKKF